MKLRASVLAFALLAGAAQEARSSIFAHAGERVQHPDGSTVCVIAHDLVSYQLVEVDFCKDWTIPSPHRGDIISGDWIRRSTSGSMQIYVEGKWVP